MNMSENLRSQANRRVLILGGYGNFGARITTALTKDNIAVIIAGRDHKKAQALLNELKSLYPNTQIDIAIFDITNCLNEQLEKLKPFIVINTCGPFQTQDYFVAKSCIEHGVHYIDLADSREFVNNIVILNEEAKLNKVLVVSGASTVPALTGAVLDEYQHQYSEINSLRYGITLGQKTPPGIATANAILSYLGKALKNKRYGWQDLYRQDYPEIGKRWMGNCDVPDLDIFPTRYGIKSIQFSAGMESQVVHLSMWLMSWLIRFGLPVSLTKHTPFLLHFAGYFSHFGTANSGMHMLIKGKDNNGKPHETQWFIIAKNGDGQQIPCMPSIILAKKSLNDEIVEYGAKPCVGMIHLKEYMAGLQMYSIQQISTPSKMR